MYNTNLTGEKINYKYLITANIRSLECSIPYEANLGIKLIRGNKSAESK